MGIADGIVLLGLYFPWVVALFGLTGALVIIADWKEIKGPFDLNQEFGWSAKVHFALGTYLVACGAGLFFVLWVDIVQATFGSWLILITVAGFGGFANVVLLHRGSDGTGK